MMSGPTTNAGIQRSLPDIVPRFNNSSAAGSLRTSLMVICSFGFRFFSFAKNSLALTQFGQSSRTNTSISIVLAPASEKGSCVGAVGADRVFAGADGAGAGLAGTGLAGATGTGAGLAGAGLAGAVSTGAGLTGTGFAGIAGTGAGLAGAARAGAGLAGAAGMGAGFAGAAGAEFGFTVTAFSGTESTGAVVAGEDCAAGEAPDSFNAHPGREQQQQYKATIREQPS
jgi:uncharacterized protein YjbI with pentapeptide repeats